MQAEDSIGGRMVHAFSRRWPGRCCASALSFSPDICPHGSRGGGGVRRKGESFGDCRAEVSVVFPWPKVPASGMAPTRPSAGRCSPISTGCWLRSGVALSLSGSASMRPGTPPPPMPLHHRVLIGYSALPRPSWTLQRPWQVKIALRRRKALLRSSSQSFK